MGGGSSTYASGESPLTTLIPVAVASLLIAFCLAGSQLYSSSAGSAALDTQLSETCASDSALTLPVPAGEPGTRVNPSQLTREIGAKVPLVDAPRRWAYARPFMRTTTALPRRLTMISVDGADTNVTPPLQPLGPGEVAVSTSNLFELQAEVGDVVNVDGARLTITQSFDDVAFPAIPSFWCGFPELFTPTSGGDPPPPFVIASLDTVASVGAGVYDEYRIIDQPLTMTDAAALEDGYATATEEWTSTFPNYPAGVPRNELERVVARAQAVRTSVDRNLAPVMLTGVIAGGIVLIAAAVLVARDRQRELRLLAVRGLPPWRLAAFVSPRLGATVLLAMIGGLLLAWGAIAGFGPSSNLEPGALTTSLWWVALATFAAVLLVTGVVGHVGDGFADVRRRRLRGGWAAIALAAAVVVLAAVAFRRLDRNGGVRTFGVESRGGDLLAMGFPLFALLAVTAVAGLIVAVIAPRLRLSGAKLGRALRLGWRRVVLESGPLVAVVVAAALAAGCFTVANALAAGAERQLTDKAQVYVGSDLSVDLFDEVAVPDDWASRTTVISSVDVKYDDNSRGELIGIDRASFGNATEMRADGSSMSLDELVEQVTPDPQSTNLTGIAVETGAEVGDVVPLEFPGSGDPVPIRIVATATFFPGKSSHVGMFVVDRQALQAITPFTKTTLLVRDPPADAITQIRDTGARVGVVLDATTAFDGSAYSALRWAYAPLATLGAWFAVVALALQLLVVSARRRQRRVADAVMRRTGFTTRGLWWASAVETGVPLAVGSAVGFGAAILAASLSIVRLDPMPGLAPPAEFLMPWHVLLATLCIVPIWTAVIATVIVRSTVRVDPMRVFQGAA